MVSRAVSLGRRALLVGLGAVSAALLLGCEDKTKKAEDAALDAVEIATPLIERDVNQVRHGMVPGAQALTKLMPDDALGKRQELQEAIKKARAGVDDLAFAKSTFFGFVAPNGAVLRSEIDPDRMVDQNVFDALPDLKKGLEAKAGMVEAFGEMDAMRGVKRGPDLAWMVGHAIPAEGGPAVGMFVTGWSLRLYARTLEQQVRTQIAEKTKERGEEKSPVVYVYILKGKGAYGDPDSPDVNTDKLLELDTLAKSKHGLKTHFEADGRVFGLAARAAPALGDDAAVAVISTVY